MVINITAPIIIAFTDKIRHKQVDNPYKYFTDKFTGEGLTTVYGCENAEEFFSLMNHLIKYPDGMWYWVLHENKCICSGACDPDDLEFFKEYFDNIEKGNKNYEF
jgi:hypothetical protein